MPIHYATFNDDDVGEDIVYPFVFPPVLRFEAAILSEFEISTNRAWGKKNVADIFGLENFTIESIKHLCVTEMTLKQYLLLIGE